MHGRLAAPQLDHCGAADVSEGSWLNSRAAILSGNRNRQSYETEVFIRRPLMANRPLIQRARDLLTDNPTILISNPRLRGRRLKRRYTIERARVISRVTAGYYKTSPDTPSVLSGRSRYLNCRSVS